jgi:hypothetical protein
MKQVTDLGDWIFSLPVKLVEAVMGPREAYLRGKNEIDRLEELNALRDVGEHLTTIYGFKGNIYKWANRLQAQKQVDEVDYVRLLFVEATYALNEAEKVLRSARLSNLELASQAALKLADAKSTYEALSKLSDADILEDRGLIDLIDEMDRLMETGTFLARLADHHRKELEKGEPRTRS